MKTQWDMTIYKMVAPNPKLASETIQWPCVRSGKGLPILGRWVASLLGKQEGAAGPGDHHRAFCDQVGNDISQNGGPQRQKGVE